MIATKLFTMNPLFKFVLVTYFSRGFPFAILFLFKACKYINLIKHRVVGEYRGFYNFVVLKVYTRL